MAIKSVSDLAKEIQLHFKRRRLRPPRRLVLESLLEAAYLASLKTEEGDSLQMRLVLVDPENPDPDPPPRPRSDRWSITRLSTPLALTVPNLVKLARAADPWCSSLAVFYRPDNSLFIWGLVDQTVHFNTMLVREVDSGYAQPGLLQVVATGTADLTIYREFAFVARLAQDRLLSSQNDVFESGPIRNRLSEGMKLFYEGVLRGAEDPSQIDGDDLAYEGETWIGTLCRLLISIQRYRHGGALLIAKSKADLDVKYALEYSRLSVALTNLALARTMQERTSDYIREEHLDKRTHSLPVDLYLDEAIAGSAVDDLLKEITGCVRFISSLSCIDGAILSTPDLKIRGFGVEILTRQDPRSVYLSRDPQPRPSTVRPVDPNHYGMRHRSMMRYCYSHPGSVGFVVSQDSEIRAMSRVGNRLLMWENLQVHSLWDPGQALVKS